MHAALVVASLVLTVLVAGALGSPVAREGQIPVSIVEVEPSAVVSELRDSPALHVAEKEPLTRSGEAKPDEALPEQPLEPLELLDPAESPAGPPKATDAETQPESAADILLRQGATQSTTPANFVAQLIQSSPIGQFLNQLTGQNQHPPAGVAADQPAAPSPAVPAFPSPADAIQSAQHAVQNAAQSLMNTTNSALQGIQNYATSFTNQLQNTFSTLTGQPQQQQQQAAAGEASTTRRPGPFQSFVSNLVGTPGASPTAAPAQPQGPLQGLISFLQGGNNNNNQPAKPVETPQDAKPAAAAVDNKLEDAQNDKPDEVFEETPNGGDSEAAIATNEVRNSGEVVVEEDSFEEANANEELIVVKHLGASEQNN